MSGFEYDVCVVGGCGHVGLPLALTFADSGLNVSIYDTKAWKEINAPVSHWPERIA